MWNVEVIYGKVGTRPPVGSLRLKREVYQKKNHIEPGDKVHEDVN